ncbi:MAG: hypothetical protein JRI59_00415 [Deltaproteobacteria bacterium]|nr:hypothetical protein [Deltaproteobacteria bacterium]
MTPRDYDDDDRERPSWREIDARRDRPHSRPLAKERRLPKKQAEWVRKMALRQAEALFKGKRGRPEYQTALRELEEAHGTKKFPAVAKKFLQEYGLPEEWGILNLLLDVPEPEVVTEVLRVMASQVASRSLVEKQGFKGRLQILALTNADAEVRQEAEEIMASL